jgi:hypothetical protein
LGNIKKKESSIKKLLLSLRTISFIKGGDGTSDDFVQTLQRTGTKSGCFIEKSGIVVDL